MLCNICDDDQKRIGQVEEKPPLDWLDAGRAGQGGGDREVDGGQDHHARDVQGEDQVVLSSRDREYSLHDYYLDYLALTVYVVGYLIDNVHENGGEVSDEEYAVKVPGEHNRYTNHILVCFLIC